MRIKQFALNSRDEVIVKIVKEILTLFKIEIEGDMKRETARDESGPRLSIENFASGGRPVRVKTVVTLSGMPENRVYHEEKTAGIDERPGSAQRRLIKLNLYDIFVGQCGMPPAPWGILHGIRPSKIVHSHIDQGMERAAIIRRLENDYAVRPDKAALLTDTAFRQRPFLEASAPDTVGIYIGIPFCLSRCLYCSFPSYVLPPEEGLRRFLAVLERDILAAAADIEKHRLRVKSVYLGGGTPTSLPAKAFAALLDLVQRSFFTADTAEFTVEAGRPDSVDDEKIAAMAQHAVSRVSVNPQTMQERTLKHIGRNHSPQDIIELFGKFRRAGMEHINMDLIIGLPGETCEDMKDTMRRIVRLAPDNITLHALALKKGSALKLNRGEYALPDDAVAQAMFDIAMRAASDIGMRPYYLYRQGYMSGNLENIGYCRPGAEGLYNIQIMEERQTIIGIGPAATTKVVHPADRSLKSSFHAKDLTTYLNCVDQYIEKRGRLFSDAFNHGEESYLC